MVSVVIPSYNRWDLTHSLLLDIYKCFPADTEVIVVDDCSKDGDVSAGLLWWKTGVLKDRLKVYVNEVNCGFLRTANFGVTRATSELVILISNDVKINDSNIAGKISSAMWDGDRAQNLVGARLLSGDTGWNTINGKTYPYLEGWLLAFWKADWIHFGGFDERYIFADCEDLDLSTTYTHNGGTLVEVELDVVHLGAQTYKYSTEREANTRKNQQLFFEKWSKNENK